MNAGLGAKALWAHNRPLGTPTRREIFSKSYQIKLKSDCIYHFPIDLEQQTDSVRLLFQIKRKMRNTI